MSFSQIWDRQVRFFKFWDWPIFSIIQERVFSTFKSSQHNWRPNQQQSAFFQNAFSSQRFRTIDSTLIITLTAEHRCWIVFGAAFRKRSKTHSQQAVSVVLTPLFKVHLMEKANLRKSELTKDTVVFMPWSYIINFCVCAKGLSSTFVW
jgi:hypothetical protein